MRRWMFPLLLVVAWLLPGLCRSHGADEGVPPEILQSRKEAEKLSEAGRHGEAELAYSALIKQCEAAVGTEHSTTLDLRFRRTLAIMDQGRLTEAERTSRELLRDATRILGPDAEQTLNIRDGHASHLYLLDRKEEARTEWRAVIAAQVRVFGPQEKSPIAVRSNLATGLMADGKYDEALPELRLMVEAQAKLLGEQNRETLEGRFLLGRALVKLGKFAEARDQFRLVTEGRAATHGQADKDTLTARENLARMLETLHDYGEMLVQVKKYAEECEKVFGPNAEETLTARNFEATALSHLGRKAEREQVARSVLAAAEGRLRPENKVVLVARRHLIESRMTPENRDETEVAYRLLLGDLKRGLGVDDRETLSVQQNLWTMVYMAGRPLDLDDLRSMVAAQSRVLGADMMNKENGRRLLVAALVKEKQFAEAEQMLREMLRIEERQPGLAMPEVCRFLAACLANQHKEEEGLAFAQRAYDGALKEFGNAGDPRMKPYVDIVEQIQKSMKKGQAGKDAEKTEGTGGKPAPPQ